MANDPNHCQFKQLSERMLHLHVHVNIQGMSCSILVASGLGLRPYESWRASNGAFPLGERET